MRVPCEAVKIYVDETASVRQLQPETGLLVATNALSRYVCAVNRRSSERASKRERQLEE